MKKIFKRGMSGLLAVLMALTVLAGFGTTTAFAASETAESYMISFPRDGDAAQIYSEDAWGHSAKNYMNGWATGSSNYTTLHCMDSFDGKVCYCIEPGLSRNVGDTYHGFGEDFWDNYPSQYNNTIEPDDIKLLLGRIMQYGYQGNLTENTFDSYLYQLVESKQKFIGQIMTSKSPVRSAEDIDETALSYAEIKALCAGNPHIKEKMDLDIDVSRLKLLKANHLSQRYALEDQIIKEFPQKIRSLEQRIEGYKADIDQLKRNTEPNEDGFSPMIMPGGTVREKKAAGDAILGLCKSMTSPDPIPIGQYRGFDMDLSFDTFSREYKITLIHQLRHTVTLGTDIFGNIQRLDNTLSAFEERMAACVEQLENTRVQLENAKAEVQKPFPQEEELAAKTARLNELNALLNLDKSENEIVDGERGEEELSRSSDDRER